MPLIPKQLHRRLALAASGLLLMGVVVGGYWYLETMRVIVFACALALALIAWREDTRWIVPCLLGAAFVWNPFFPDYLLRIAWQMLDVLGVVLFAAAALAIPTPAEQAKPTRLAHSAESERVRVLRRLLDERVISREDYDAKVQEITEQGQRWLELAS